MIHDDWCALSSCNNQCIIKNSLLYLVAEASTCKFLIFGRAFSEKTEDKIDQSTIASQLSPNKDIAKTLLYT